MARLINWPIGLGRISYQRMSGPRSVGANSSESTTGFVQSVSSAFGLWVYQLAIQTIKGRKYRLYRGMVTAAHGGANAVRVPFNDPDVMSFSEAGIDISEADIEAGVPFSNDEPFSNGCNWGLARPVVPVSVAVVEGGTIITLADEYWGRQLIGGEWLGFCPLHFGKYEVTQVIDAEAGQYRIWPPLRAALTTESFARLDNIVMAMRLQGESSGTVQRGVAVSEGNTMTLIEVQDADVREYFSD